MIRKKPRLKLLSDSESEQSGKENDENPIWHSPTSKKLAELGDSDDDSNDGRPRNVTIHADNDGVIENDLVMNNARPDSPDSRAVSPEVRKRPTITNNEQAFDVPAEEELEEIFADDDDLIAEVDMNVGAEALLNQDQAGGANVAIKKKRVVKRRQTLNAKVLIDKDKGLLSLNRSCRKIKFKGKGSEEQDLESLLWNIEHWAHRIGPQLKFADFLEQAERLGKKQEVKNFLRSVRSGELEFGLPDIDSDDYGDKARKQNMDFDDDLLEEENFVRNMSTLQEQSFGGDSLTAAPFSQNMTLNSTGVNSFHASKLVTSTPFPKHLISNQPNIPLIDNSSDKSQLPDEIARKIAEKRQQALAKRAQRLSNNLVVHPQLNDT